MTFKRPAVLVCTCVATVWNRLQDLDKGITSYFALQQIPKKEHYIEEFIYHQRNMDKVCTIRPHVP